MELPVDRELVKQRFLDFLKSGVCIDDGYISSNMFQAFIDKYYSGWGGIFVDEIWSNDKKLAKSPIQDESYGDFCFRVRNHKGRDVTFLSSIYNSYKESILIDVDKHIESIEKKLSYGLFHKRFSIDFLSNEMNKWSELKESKSKKKFDVLNKEEHLKLQREINKNLPVVKTTSDFVKFHSK